ncbi:MAG: PilW family protein [Deltaproteobacteria bacterium]|nr:PilW family protein [Deltaproteobacteria bacterium]
MKPNPKNGFTLVEILFALLLGGLVTTAVLNIFIIQANSFANQNLVTEMQRNAKIALDSLVMDLRMAGFQVPPVGVSFYNKTTGGKENIFAITPANNATGCDQVRILYSDNQPPLSTTTTAALANSNDSLPIPVQPADIGKFRQGDIIMISVGASAALLQVTGINGSELLHAVEANINPPNSINLFPTAGFPAGAQVTRVKLLTYRIDSASDPSHPALQLGQGDGTFQNIATNIEDLQLAYRDNTPSSGVWYCVPGRDFPADFSNAAIRDVRVNILSRAKDIDSRFSGKRPGLEDRNAGTTDNYRRRLLTSTVMVRNLFN